METTDLDLMNRLCAGEIDRLGDLYDRHARGVLRHCLQMVGDEEAARDLTQEVFMRVFRYSSTWEGRSQFTTWMYRITHNVCLDHLRREQRRTNALENQAVAGKSLDAGVSRGTYSEDPARVLEVRESWKRLNAALDSLSPTHREIILLVRFQDMSYDEVSQVLGCTVNAARVRFHRALQALRKEFMKSGRITR